mmetsp:Transcript_93480/g.166321  ORF Transcript_93480/g.166321 Transcript_93480/m.166321 type:complete len:409 (-) Transcript_93480:50-1276(-)
MTRSTACRQRRGAPAILAVGLLGLLSCHSAFLASFKRSRELAASTIARGSVDKDKAKSDAESLVEMGKGLKKMARDPRPRGGKRVGTEVWFDATLPLPLGLRLDEAPSGDMVGVSEVYEDSNAEAYNRAVLAETDTEKQKNWIQPGDRLRAVNGKTVSTQDDAVTLLTAQEPGETITLSLSRDIRGALTVVFPEPARSVVVYPKSKLRDAAKMAGHEVEICPEDGGCKGTCWHTCDSTGDIYQLCIDECTASVRPSSTVKQRLSVAENFNDMMGVYNEENTWDNTEPLVLRPCPEIANQFFNPHVGLWYYDTGRYRVQCDEEGCLVFEEGEVQGKLIPDDEEDESNDWLVAELPDAGTIRIRRKASGFFDNWEEMESQFKNTGSDEWTDILTSRKTDEATARILDNLT